MCLYLSALMPANALDHYSIKSTAEICILIINVSTIIHKVLLPALHTCPGMTVTCARHKEACDKLQKEKCWRESYIEVIRFFNDVIVISHVLFEVRFIAWLLIIFHHISSISTVACFSNFSIPITLPHNTTVITFGYTITMVVRQIHVSCHGSKLGWMTTDYLLLPVCRFGTCSQLWVL